jgi:hypothetical protein
MLVEFQNNHVYHFSITALQTEEIQLRANQRNICSSGHNNCLEAKHSRLQCIKQFVSVPQFFSTF